MLGIEPKLGETDFECVMGRFSEYCAGRWCGAAAQSSAATSQGEQPSETTLARGGSGFFIIALFILAVTFLAIISAFTIAVGMSDLQHLF